VPVTFAREEAVEDRSANKESKEKDSRDFVIMPIPISNPTIGTGLAAAAMYLYKIDEASPTSNTMAGALYTDTESWAAGVAQTTHFKADRYRANGVAGYGSFNLKFYGIGNEAGDRGRHIDINQEGVVFIPKFLRAVRENLYAGIQYRLLKIDTSFPNLNIPDCPICDELRENLRNRLNIVSSGVGLLCDYDTRDNSYYPFHGTFLTMNATIVDEAVGSDMDYQIYEASYSRYMELARNHILALGGVGRFTFGEVPIFDLCLFGMNNYLRGYVGGQYRDKMMLAGQVEYRWRFYKRFGMVAFAGVGEVAPSIDEFNSENLLPSAGAGLRFMASEENRVNVSIDYAFGKDTDALYFRIGEAF
jgi:outer membrane protein assembly factor BamA